MTETDDEVALRIAKAVDHEFSEREREAGDNPNPNYAWDDEWLKEFSRRLLAHERGRAEPKAELINWPEMNREEWSAWLKDRSIMFDPYIQGPLMRVLADFIGEADFYEAPKGCQCEACRPHQHASDCSVHNMPAYPNGPCDCGAAPAAPSQDAVDAKRYRWWRADTAGLCWSQADLPGLQGKHGDMDEITEAELDAAIDAAIGDQS